MEQAEASKWWRQLVKESGRGLADPPSLLTWAELASAVEAVFGERYPFTVTGTKPMGGWYEGRLVQVETEAGYFHIHDPNGRLYMNGQIVKDAGPTEEVAPAVAEEKCLAFMERVFPWFADIQRSELRSNSMGFTLNWRHRIGDVAMPSRLYVSSGKNGRVRAFRSYHEPDFPEPTVVLTKDEAVAIAVEEATHHRQFRWCVPQFARLAMKRDPPGYWTYWNVVIKPMLWPPGERPPDWDQRDAGHGGTIEVDAATGEVIMVSRFR